MATSKTKSFGGKSITFIVHSGTNVTAVGNICPEHKSPLLIHPTDPRREFCEFDTKVLNELILKEGS